MEGLLFRLHISVSEIESRIADVLTSPKESGTLELIVRRPKPNARVVVETGVLDVDEGLIGDNWLTRGNRWLRGGDPKRQITVMNWRFAKLVAVEQSRIPLAGDQLYVDLDLSKENVPPGTRLAVGDAIIEVTTPPHLGCKKFVERFGVDAMNFANSEFGRQHNLRGVNARVVTGGEIAVGDAVSKLVLARRLLPLRLQTPRPGNQFLPICLMNPGVCSSVRFPSVSNLSPAVAIITSGLFIGNMLRKTIIFRRSYWARAVAIPPIEAPIIAAGLPPRRCRRTAAKPNRSRSSVRPGSNSYTRASKNYRVRLAYLSFEFGDYLRRCLVVVLVVRRYRRDVERFDLDALRRSSTAARNAPRLYEPSRRLPAIPNILILSAILFSP